MMITPTELGTTELGTTPKSRTDLDRQAIELAGLLLVAGVWAERQVARRVRTLFGPADAR